MNFRSSGWLLGASFLIATACGSTSKATPDAPKITDGATTIDAPAGNPDAPLSTAGPDVAGPYTVTKSSANVSGGALVIYSPNITGRKIPLVIMKHGFQLKTSNYNELCTRIASHGFVVVGVDTDAGLFGGPTNIDERDTTVAGITYAITNLALVDADKVAVLGHSRGGKLAAMVTAIDPRVDATLLLDPVNGCGMGPFTTTCPDIAKPAIAGAITKPVGIMGETNNSGANSCAPAAQNYVTVRNAITAAPWNVEWTFTGADHMDFTDDGGGLVGSLCSAGPGNETQIRKDMRTLSVAFVRRHLLGDNAMDAWLTGASLPAGIVKRGP
jgi:pimeloyl-ACP methyl ester carboxylesterase